MAPPDEEADATEYDRLLAILEPLRLEGSELAEGLRDRSNMSAEDSFGETGGKLGDFGAERSSGAVFSLGGLLLEVAAGDGCGGSLGVFLWSLLASPSEDRRKSPKRVSCDMVSFVVGEGKA